MPGPMLGSTPRARRAAVLPVPGSVEQDRRMSSRLPAAGVRPAWSRLPGRVRTAVEERAGASVVEARDQTGGFSPGVAARLLLADGRRVFVKAVASSVNANSAALHRGEARTL